MTFIDQTPATVPTREPYDRHAWERAVMKSTLHHHSKHVAMALAHFAGEAGYLAPGGPQHVDSLFAATGLFGRHVRNGLLQLERYRFISRPDIADWRDAEGRPRNEVRPVTLTTPAAEGGAERTEPAHPSPAVS